YADEKGYMMLLCSTDYSLEKEKKMIEKLCSQKVSGVMITTCSNENAHIKKLKSYNIPYIYLNRTYEDDLERCLRVNNRAAAAAVVSYLIEMGHKKIGGLFRSFDNMIYRERYEGMKDAIFAHGLEFDENLVLFDIEDSEKSYQIIEKHLRKEERPGAFFASDDMLAYGMYKVAYDLKLSIPEQLSIVGFDNSLMADVIAPHLTTCEMPTERLAQLAVEYIDTYIRTGEMIHMPVLEGKMLFRESVARK
ncbi:MAG TPA: substrate-binding domain-containing protein, partial [Candidatus Ventrisoma faecale]|nr:substrate-binding domain-containing protein [Candidatus Ventrisoma faecale]